jgi:DNA repair protein RecO
MEATLNTKAIILNRKFFNEKDERIFLYSKDFGRLELIGRGTKKIQSKLSSHLEPINLVDLMIVKGRQYDYIGAAISKNCFYKTKSNFKKVILIENFFSKILQTTKENEKEENIFYLLVNFLFLLDNLEKKEHWQLASNLATIKLFGFLGYLVDKNFFNNRKIDSDCQDYFKVIRFIYQNNLIDSFKKIQLNNKIDKLLSATVLYVENKYLY